MKTQYLTASTLDGFIVTEDDSLDWLFALGNVTDTNYPDFIKEVGALVMGASTYEWILRHAKETEQQLGSAWPYQQPAWIFTHRTLPKIEGADIHFVQGNVIPVYEEIRKMIGDKNLWIVGGGDLAGQFYDAGLLDEIIVHLASVTLGKGKPLFPRHSNEASLLLTKVRYLNTAFVELYYSVVNQKK